MSIDTAAKRFSAVNVCLPWRGINAYPDGGGTLGDESGDSFIDEDGNLIGDNTISAINRGALAHLYSGFFVGNAFTLVAVSGTYSLTGYSATFTSTTHIGTADKRFSVINVGLPWRGINAFPDGAVTTKDRFALNHLYDGFAVTAVNQYTLTATSGIYIYAGEPSFSDFEIACVSGVYAYTGSDALITSVRFINAQSGVYTYTGYDADLVHFLGATLEAISGTYALVGYDATFERPRQIKPISGVYNLVGQPAEFTWYDINGNPVLPVVFQGGGFPEYIPYKKKPKKKVVQEAITTPAEIVAIIEKPKKPPKDTKKEDEDRRKKEEELLLLG